MDFLTSLYREHLEEAAILYDSRAWKKRNGLSNLARTLDLDLRLESHLDALAMDERAIGTCGEGLERNDPGECYAAARVFLRLNMFGRIERVFLETDREDEVRLSALVEAVCHETQKKTADWLLGGFLDGLFEKEAPLSRAAARIAGFYRFDLSDRMFEVVRKYPEDKKTVLTILHAAGRIRPYLGSEFLLGLVGGADMEISNAAAEAILRTGTRPTLKRCMTLKKPSEWPPVLLGLHGDSELLEKAMDEIGTLVPEHLLAAGLTGDLRFVQLLLGSLGNNDLGEKTALALHLMTGLSFYEECFVPEISSEEDLETEEEKTAYRNGTLYPDGKIPGTTAIRLSRDRAAWEDGITANRRKLTPTKRYRLGAPCSPSVLHCQMSHPETSDVFRDLAHDELVIRYGMDARFETGMYAPDQIRTLNGLKKATGGAGFLEGAWYSCAEPMDEHDEKPKEQQR
jgi:hypothetical protein